MPKQSNQRVIEAIQKVVGSRAVPLHEPSFKGNEWSYIKKCLDTGFVSSVGSFVTQFESELAKYTGADYAIAVASGTAALHISLKLSGVRPQDEVLTPTLSFIATANAVSYCGATPHFVDSDLDSWGIDARKLRNYLAKITEQRGGFCVSKVTGRVIRAMIPMHVFGHPCDLDGLLAVACDYNIALVEDAAESIGSYYYGKHTGTFGALGALSFNGNKTITTGGGGAILTNNKDLANKARHITTTSKIPHPWNYTHDEVGFNYRMPNLNAALGCAQLEMLPSMLASKRQLTARYLDVFKTTDDVALKIEPTGCVSNYWLQTLMLVDSQTSRLEDLLSEANKQGIMTRPIWGLTHEQLPYKDCPKMDLNQATNIAKRAINIPSSVGLIE